MAGEASWFEIGVADTKRARSFYGSLFGWTFEAVPPGDGSVIATTGIPGGLHGGDQGASPYVFFAVDDLAAALGRVRELGGEADELEVNADEAQSQAFGRFALCRDDQGSPFGLHEPPRAQR